MPEVACVSSQMHQICCGQVFISSEIVHLHCPYRTPPRFVNNMLCEPGEVLWSPQYADEETQLFIVQTLLMTAYFPTQQLNKM